MVSAMEVLRKDFENRESIIQYVKTLAPWAGGEASHTEGGRSNAIQKLRKIDPENYSSTRNFGNGAVTHLSPYIHHGILTLNEVRNHALSIAKSNKTIQKFIQELAWRDFWQRVAELHPTWLWNDVEAYKTGYTANDYANRLPSDILNGATGTACIDNFIHNLTDSGYLHNHARMYLASYIVHFRRIKWQAGAQWFLEQLIDGDEASNNFSWQWIASTFSNKPYIFNLENVQKYFGESVDTSRLNNIVLNADYPTISSKLFPNLSA